MYFAFFPRKHVSDLLPDAFVNEVLKEDAALQQTSTSTGINYMGALLFEAIAQSEDCSRVEQPNFYLRLQRVLRHFFSTAGRIIRIFCLNQWVTIEQKPFREYVNFVPLLPKYYSFLFRLTPP